VAPCDLEILTFMGEAVSAAGNSITLRDVTNSADLEILAYTSTNRAQAWLQYDQTNHSLVSKGTVLAMRLDTDTTAGFTDVAAVAIARVRGHINSHPRLD
jgi:hypothetical protein